MRQNPRSALGPRSYPKPGVDPGRVSVERGTPVRISIDRRGFSGGRVEHCAGPWRTSGGWWIEEEGWDRDAWDVSLSDGATYRVYRERDTDAWFIEGVVD